MLTQVQILSLAFVRKMVNKTIKKKLSIIILCMILLINLNLGLMGGFVEVQPSLVSPIDLVSSPIVPSDTPNEKLWSDEGICKHMKGCWMGNECYPFGYIKDGSYCYDKAEYYYSGFYTINFVNQSNSNERCEYDFQCKSNGCFNGKCMSGLNTFIKDIMSRLTILENKKDYQIPEEKQMNNSNQSLKGPQKSNGITGFFTRLFN